VSDWIFKYDLEEKDYVKHSKYYCYEKKLLARPEFMIEDVYMKIKENDYKILVEYANQKEADLKSQSEDAANAAATQKKDDKKDPKKDPKAGKKDDPKGGVKTVEVEDPELPYQDKFSIIQRAYKKLEKKDEKLLQHNKKKPVVETKPLTDEEKKIRKQKGLLENIDVILAKDINIAVKIALNQPEEIIDDSKTDEAPAAADPKKKK
jgi:hypothetical protein